MRGIIFLSFTKGKYVARKHLPCKNDSTAVRASVGARTHPPPPPILGKGTEAVLAEREFPP